MKINYSILAVQGDYFLDGLHNIVTEQLVGLWHFAVAFVTEVVRRRIGGAKHGVVRIDADLDGRVLLLDALLRLTLYGFSFF